MQDLTMSKVQGEYMILTENSDGTTLSPKINYEFELVHNLGDKEVLNQFVDEYMEECKEPKNVNVFSFCSWVQMKKEEVAIPLSVATKFINLIQQL